MCIYIYTDIHSNESLSNYAATTGRVVVWDCTELLLMHHLVRSCTNLLLLFSSCSFFLFPPVRWLTDAVFREEPCF